MTALAVYVLAALTVGAIYRQHVARRGESIAWTLVMSALWPLVLVEWAFDWLASKRAARRAK